MDKGRVARCRRPAATWNYCALNNACFACASRQVARMVSGPTPSDGNAVIRFLTYFSSDVGCSSTFTGGRNAEKSPKGARTATADVAKRMRRDRLREEPPCMDHARILEFRAPVSA